MTQALRRVPPRCTFGASFHPNTMRIAPRILALSLIAACSQPAPKAAPAPVPAPPAPAPQNDPTQPGRGGPPAFPAAGLGQGQDSTGGRGGLPAAGPRPYNRVITPGAQTRRGMFAVHRVGDRLYFEIPSKEL